MDGGTGIRGGLKNLCPKGHTGSIPVPCTNMRPWRNGKTHWTKDPVPKGVQVQILLGAPIRASSSAEEHLTFNQGAKGSSPFWHTNMGGWVSGRNQQTVNLPRKPRRFEFFTAHFYESLAQLEECLTLNQGVPGSIPGWLTKDPA